MKNLGLPTRMAAKHEKPVGARTRLVNCHKRRTIVGNFDENENSLYERVYVFRGNGPWRVQKMAARKGGRMGTRLT